MRQTPSTREVLEALEWVRGEIFRLASPDFIRQQQAEARVRELCARLLRSRAQAARTPAERQRAKPSG